MDFKLHFFGEHSLGFYLASIIFLLLGHLTNKVITYSRKGTEEKFSFSFWVKDNWRDFAFSLVISFITIRFTTDILYALKRFAGIDASFVSDKMFYYFLIGLGYQSLFQLLRKKLSFLKK